MAERFPAIVDASVVSRWYVKSPPFVEEALKVWRDFNRELISIAAPENLLHEVAGTIHRAVFSRRLNARQGMAQLDHFLDSNITFVETNSFVRPALELSFQYGCSYYDAIYLEVARQYEYPFIHADGNLKRALNGRFPLEVWIEDYKYR